MKGREGKSDHSGLHCLNGADMDLVRVQDDHRVPDTHCNLVYSAVVQLGSKDKYNKISWDSGKLSTFFPDTMCLEHITEAVTCAWKNWKGLQNSSQQKHKNAFEHLGKIIENTSVKWVGNVTIYRTNGSFFLLVGSLQTGTDTNKIYNAFPAINGRFTG
jgi:hypothetical protein